ncbi:galactose mutarotase [Capsicum galapagoense]
MPSNINLLFCLFILHLWAVISVTEQDIGVYEIKKGDFSVKVTNYGARIISVFLPDKHGEVDDVVLGYDTIEEYQNDTTSFGALLGRVANRIGGAQFTLNGTVYKLVANDGPNTLHAGVKGFSRVVWNVSKYNQEGSYRHITLTYHSADGEEGFPGDLLVSVTYALKDPYKLTVLMTAKALNKATPVNLAQHSYWNLGGHNSGDILSNVVQIFASHITPVDKYLIPTGEISPVKNTPYDFRKPRRVGSQIKELQSGYDINYALDSAEKMKHVAIVHDEKSGRVMEVEASAPGVQFYTANSLIQKGKGGYVYQPHAALCFETQGFPDAVNHPNFPSTIVTPGKVYVHKLMYTFSIMKYWNSY